MMDIKKELDMREDIVNLLICAKNEAKSKNTMNSHVVSMRFNIPKEKYPVIFMFPFRGNPGLISTKIHA